MIVIKFVLVGSKSLRIITKPRLILYAINCTLRSFFCAVYTYQ